jgi:hypothetical protein
MSYYYYNPLEVLVDLRVSERTRLSCPSVTGPSSSIARFFDSRSMGLVWMHMQVRQGAVTEDE